MRLLFDQNLSHRLIARLADLYPDSEHVRNLGLSQADDGEIWEFAKQHQFAVATKDDGFHARSVLYGHPPKVLWVRSGNCSTDLVETLLRKNIIEVLEFDSNPDASFLMLS